MSGIVTQGLGGVKLATQGFGSAVAVGPLGTTLNVATAGARGEGATATGTNEKVTTGGGAG